MENLIKFLSCFRNDVFKLLPMKEEELDGIQNYLGDYIYALIVNAKGGLATYPELKSKKKYLYTINNLTFLATNDVSYDKWRNIVLRSTRDINDMRLSFEEARDVQRD